MSHFYEVDYMQGNERKTLQIDAVDESAAAKAAAKILRGKPHGIARRLPTGPATQMTPEFALTQSPYAES